MVLNDEEYDGAVETTDWRYAAAITGLVRYLSYFDCEYDSESNPDILKYHESDLTEERYLEYVEMNYADDMHHIFVEEILEQEEFSEDLLKLINTKLTANTVMKKYFSKIKFDGTNQRLILDIINENRRELIKETYRNKSNLYANFANTNQLFSEEKTYSRLVGYYIDGPKKGKSISYQFDLGTYVSQDSKLFDYIPFAFTIGREAFFINDNSSIEELIRTNNALLKSVRNAVSDGTQSNADIRKTFFQSIIESKEYIDFDVEVILKDKDHSYFETMYLRKESIDVLRKLKKYESFCFSHKMNDNYYLNIQKKVSTAIINMTKVDELIELFLQTNIKLGTSDKYVQLINQLIWVNLLVSGGEKMYQQIREARESAQQVIKNQKLRNNSKIKSYRTKLVSALVFKDYKRYCDILVQLAGYTDLELDFAYKLFENFEANKEIAYAFVNALGSNNYDTNREDD